MSSLDNELIVAFREEMRSGFGMFVTEMREGFAGFKTEMREGLAGFKTEMREGFTGFSTEMREGLSQVSSRVDRTNELLLETRSEMSSKLTGISDFLIQSEGSHNKSDKRLDSLETRVTKLENEKKRQP